MYKLNNAQTVEAHKDAERHYVTEKAKLQQLERDLEAQKKLVKKAFTSYKKARRSL